MIILRYSERVSVLDIIDLTTAVVQIQLPPPKKHVSFSEVDRLKFTTKLCTRLYCTSASCIVKYTLPSLSSFIFYYNLINVRTYFKCGSYSVP